MKKYLFTIATVALFASCAEKDSFKEVVSPDVEIGFSSYTGKLTRAENSPVTGDNKKHALETYHSSFKVWGSKYVAKGTNPETYDETQVFIGQVVNHQDADANANPAVSEGWVYTPIRFWDKSATKYDFYAAAPSDLSWSWDNDTKKLSLSNFAVDGATIAASSSIDAAAVFGAKDLMISEDIPNHTTYTTDKVNLSFIHILSRLNICVKKATPILDDFVVKLESIKVYNMTSNGNFNEGEDDPDNSAEGGNHSRWLAASTPAKFTAGVGYATETEVETTLNYVYQALAIPQEIEYESDIKLDGSNVSENSKPYLTIEYSIYEIDETTQQAKTNPVDSYSYTYNLADMFNGTNNEDNDDTNDDIDFNEGWMYTLNITINPVAIEFDADVYEWQPKDPVNVQVPDLDNN